MSLSQQRASPFQCDSSICVPSRFWQTPYVGHRHSRWSIRPCQRPVTTHDPYWQVYDSTRNHQVAETTEQQWSRWLFYKTYQAPRYIEPSNSWILMCVAAFCLMPNTIHSAAGTACKQQRPSATYRLSTLGLGRVHRLYIYIVSYNHHNRMPILRQMASLEPCASVIHHRSSTWSPWHNQRELSISQLVRSYCIFVYIRFIMLTTRSSQIGFDVIILAIPKILYFRIPFPLSSSLSFYSFNLLSTPISIDWSDAFRRTISWPPRHLVQLYQCNSAPVGIRSLFSFSIHPGHCPGEQHWCTPARTQGNVDSSRCGLSRLLSRVCSMQYSSNTCFSRWLMIVYFPQCPHPQAQSLYPPTYGTSRPTLPFHPYSAYLYTYVASLVLVQAGLHIAATLSSVHEVRASWTDHLISTECYSGLSAWFCHIGPLVGSTTFRMATRLVQITSCTPAVWSLQADAIALCLLKACQYVPLGKLEMPRLPAYILQPLPVPVRRHHAWHPHERDCVHPHPLGIFTPWACIASANSADHQSPTRSLRQC